MGRIGFTRQDSTQHPPWNIWSWRVVVGVDTRGRIMAVVRLEEVQVDLGQQVDLLLRLGLPIQSRLERVVLDQAPLTPMERLAAIQFVLA